MDRILVGLDTSPRAPEVLEAAESLAQRAGGKLLLFRAVGLPLEIPREAYSLSPDELSDQLEARAHRELEAIAATIPKELLLGVAVSIGTPWQAVCDAAKAHDIDLIVIGSHGYSGVDHILGTTAARVVNHASRSVLVVRPARPQGHAG